MAFNLKITLRITQMPFAERKVYNVFRKRHHCPRDTIIPYPGNC